MGAPSQLRQISSIAISGTSILNAIVFENIYNAGRMSQVAKYCGQTLVQGGHLTGQMIFYFATRPEGD
jgi:hypothetical protein